MIAAIDWTAASTILSGFAIFFAVGILPAAWWFHRKVVKPLSFVLGLKQEDSPTGEQIPSIPIQLNDMRKNQVEFKAAQVNQSGEIAIIKAEVFPNHGGSLRDVVDRSETGLAAVKLQVVDVQTTLDKHVSDEKIERERIAALALKTASELAEFTARTAAEEKANNAEG